MQTTQSKLLNYSSMSNNRTEDGQRTRKHADAQITDSDSEHEFNQYKVNFDNKLTQSPRKTKKKSPFPPHFERFILKEKTNFYY